MWRDERLPSRFWDKVVATPGCWNWTGAKIKRGYGSFRDSRTSLPHRLAYMVLVGEIPEGYEIDHLCKNTSCVRPLHLEAVTPRVNSLRSTNVAAHYALRDRCKHGHLFSDENTEWQGHARICLTCRKLNNLAATKRRRRDGFAKSRPDMLCQSCGLATPLPTGQFDLESLVYCVYCGACMKDLTSKARDNDNRGAVA